MNFIIIALLRKEVLPDSMDARLKTAMSTVISDLTARGFVLPMRFVVVGSGGTMKYGQYTPSEDEGFLDVNVFAEHLPEDIIDTGFPINVMFIDAESDAYRFRIEDDGIVIGEGQRTIDTTAAEPPE